MLPIDSRGGPQIRSISHQRALAILCFGGNGIALLAVACLGLDAFALVWVGGACLCVGGGMLIAAVASDRNKRRRGGSPTVFRQPAGAGTPDRVLILDDDAGSAALLAELLDRLCQTRIALAEEDAAVLIRQWRPTLVVADLRAPGRDGLQLCRTLKASEATRRIPFVLATASTAERVLLEGWKAGIDDFVFKPFHPVEVQTRVRALLSKQLEVTTLQHRLEVTERLASGGLLASTVAHEINNPLTFVLSSLSKAAAVLSDETGFAAPDARQMLLQLVRRAQVGTERVQGVVRHLRAGASETPTLLDVQALLESALEIALVDFPFAVHLVRNYAAVPKVEANATRLGQVFLNLLVNAVQALPRHLDPRSSIRITTRCDHPSKVVVKIEDTGSGISPGVLKHAFEPFFTTKPTGQGSGLGLSVSRKIIEGLGGTLELTSEPGQGTCVRLVLPSAARVPAGRGEQASSLRRARILVIDDDPLVVLAFEQVLAQAHDVVGMTDAAKAIALVATGVAFDLVFCDLMMPQMSGIEFHAALRHLAPGMLRDLYFTTGGVFTREGAEFLERQPNALVEKPFVEATLHAIVSRRLS